ncbi:MAG TPA: PKD domain-containing protein, partial [Flavobacteriales bacterium]|nr:PKD domain-containing protein [Flavobacteriales bacterium]
MTFPRTLNLSRLLAPGRAATFALALASPTVGALAQAFTITEPSISTCTGAFLDSGGEGASGYGNNESFTSTICSDQAGQSISLTWITFNLSTEGSTPTDQITIYDGPDVGSPIIGTYTGTNSPGIVSASFANTSGCLTVQFTSNEAGVGIFAATISCYVPCQPPMAVATMGAAMPNLICQDEVVTFNGAASYAAPGRTITQYTWDFDDGNLDSTSGPNVMHGWHVAGEYVVQLLIEDDIGCLSVNRVDLQNWVSTTPDFDLTPDQEICLGASVDLNGNATPVTWTELPHADFGDGVALPDNVGESFPSDITYTVFQPGSTLTDINQLQSICVDMEHTFMGDLVIQIACPNGQTAILHQQGGGGLFLGDANDADDVDPVGGTCWHYCWSPTSTNGTWEYNSDSGVSTPATQGPSLPPGTYESVQPLSNLLGCPLNGAWTFTITDLWSADNGFLCSWEMGFDPALYPDLTQYTPTLGLDAPDSSWWAGPEFVVDANNHLNGTVTPTTEGTFQYIFSVIDNFGCTYTDTTNVIVNPSPQGPPVIVGDQDICSGETSTLSTTLVYDDYAWSNNTYDPTTTVGGGTYTVTVGAGDCTFTSDPFTVNEHAAPQPEITGLLVNCSGQPAVL